MAPDSLTSSFEQIRKLQRSDSLAGSYLNHEKKQIDHKEEQYKRTFYIIVLIFLAYAVQLRQNAHTLTSINED